MRERSYSKTQMAWMVLFAVTVLLVSSPAHAVWRNLSVPAVSPNWTLYGVYGVSKTEAWAVGSDFVNLKGVLLHFLNGVWVSVKPPNVSLQWELFDVNFTSPSEGWAVGRDSFNHKGVLLHYQNGVWVSVPTPVVGSSWYLISVQFTSASEGWAVGVDDSDHGIQRRRPPTLSEWFVDKGQPPLCPANLGPQRRLLYLCAKRVGRGRRRANPTKGNHASMAKR